MSDNIRLSVNVNELADRLSRTLPNLTRDEIITGMRMIVGKLEAKVIQNIHARFDRDESMKRPPHIRIEDAVLGTVTVLGDMVIGEVGIDMEAVPYARIQEYGGGIPPHVIRPRSYALGVRISTLKNPLMLVEDAEAGYDTLALHHVNHPGAHIAARHFMQEAAESFQAIVGEDLTAAWQRALMRSGF